MKTIKQKHIISAQPEEVYTALVNPFTIELWSGYPAQMSTEEGSEFSIFEGDISGKNIRFEENKLVVQQWYFGDQEEESIVTIRLSEHQMGTRADLEHTNVPDEDVPDIDEGWREYYWGAIKEFFK
jgi:activator of HSP90 ATPase